MSRGLRGVVEKENVEEKSQEEPKTFFEKAEQLKNKLKLGAHHKMERFTVMLGVSVLCLTLCTGIAFTKNRIDIANMAVSQAVFTTDLEFSLSKQTGNVLGVYGNAENTDRMILLKFENPANMSADAKNYQVFVTGQNRALKYQPETSFSVFGATGYCVIRFQQDEPFPNEILDITIRSNSKLTGMAKPTEETTDASFSKFDQVKLYANIGADKVVILDTLKTGEKDPIKLYTALVAEPKDQELHKTVKSMTEDLKILLARKAEYENRITSFGYVAPIEPIVIRGDYIDDQGIFQSQTDVVLSYDFDYSTKTIADGYLKQVIGNMSEYNDYMKAHTEKGVDSTVLARKAERETVVPTVIAVSSVNGSELDFKTVVTGTSPSSDVAVKDAYQQLESTWKSYIDLKRELQIATAREFLVLDADVQSQTIGYNEISSEDENAIFYY